MRGRGGSGLTFMIVIQQLTVIHLHMCGFRMAKNDTCNYARPGTEFGDDGLSGTS